MKCGAYSPHQCQVKPVRAGKVPLIREAEGEEEELERVNEGVRAREHRAGGTLSVSQTALKSLSGRAAVF